MIRKCPTVSPPLCLYHKDQDTCESYSEIHSSVERLVTAAEAHKKEGQPVDMHWQMPWLHYQRLHSPEQLSDKPRFRINLPVSRGTVKKCREHAPWPMTPSQLLKGGSPVL